MVTLVFITNLMLSRKKKLIQIKSLYMFRGIQIAHLLGSFKTGMQAVDWDIQTVLRHMYFLFKKTLLMENFLKIKGS